MSVELVMLSNHFILFYPLLLSQHQGLFQMSQSFISGAQSIGASASVLPMNIQGWFPLGLSDFPSLDGLNLIVVDFYPTFHLYLVFYVCIMFKKYFHTLWL